MDAIAVHAACGVWGMLASAAFADVHMLTDYYGPFPGDSQVVSQHLVHFLWFTALYRVQRSGFTPIIGVLLPFHNCSASAACRLPPLCP